MELIEIADCGECAGAPPVEGAFEGAKEGDAPVGVCPAGV